MHLPIAKDHPWISRKLQIILEIRKKMHILGNYCTVLNSQNFLILCKKFASFYLSLNSVVVIALTFHLGGPGSNPDKGNNQFN